VITGGKARAGVDELLVQLGHLVRVVQHHLGDDGAGLQVGASLQFEEAALGADHGTHPAGVPATR